MAIGNQLTAQLTGFSQDRRVDTPIRQYLSGYKAAEDESRTHFIRDYAGSMSAGFSLFRDVDMSVYELLSTNFSLSDKDQIQKIVFSPFRLSRSTTPLMKVLYLFKLNVVQKKDLSTFGGGFGYDNTTLGTSRRQKLLKEVFQGGGTIRSPRAPEDNENFEAYEKAVLIPFKENVLDSLSLNFYERLARSVVKFTIGYNQQFFSILGAKGSIPDFDSVNYFGTKANNLTTALTYSVLNGKFNLAGSYNYYFLRQSARKEQLKIPYHGYGFAASYRALSFIRDKSRLRATEAYKKSLFVPGILLGASWERKTAHGAMPYIEEGLKAKRVFTPFLDIMISPAAQFRIGLPIQKNTKVDGVKEALLGTNIQYALQFSNLN